jgi:hypothetical protein
LNYDPQRWKYRMEDSLMIESREPSVAGRRDPGVGFCS